jgi:prolyl-tRNA synthetase
MRYSQLFGQTLREAPADSPSAGFAFLARAAYLRPPSNLLPLGQQSYNRLLALIDTQLKNLNGQEISPETDQFALAESEIQSYRQLPRFLYNRDFPRLNAFILAPDGEVCEKLVVEFNQVIGDFLSKIGIPFLESASHSFYFPLTSGNETVLKCPACGYLEPLELSKKTVTPPPSEDLLPTEKVLTPDCPTIEALARYLNLPESKTAKALMLIANYHNKEEFLFVVVRGDTTLSMEKLKQLTGADEFIPANEPQIKAAGAEPGYASPIGLKNVRVIIDQLIPVSPNLVAGGNEHGYHLQNTNYGRDYTASLVADITATQTGDPCPECKTPLGSQKADSLVKTERLSPTGNSGSFTDDKGQPGKVWHAKISIDIFKILLAAAETLHDEKGLTLPEAIAPYNVNLVVIPGKSVDTISPAEKLYEELQTAGITALYDDRDERAGVKFNDADLIGCPVRITLGERNLQNGMVEFKRRTSQESQLIPLSEIISHIKQNG